MAVRIRLECGDSSSLRSKQTPEGYTHDWEVYVKGADNAEIHHYIEKIVFMLHETFTKPKRVIKEPPYIIKESGYAGFDIPIQIYLKTGKNEPKKNFQFMYNLNLVQSGPPVTHTFFHTEVINNPSEELRKKLIKGGAIPASGSETASDKGEVKTLPMVGKPKLSGNDVKKHRISELKSSDPFKNLFGTPIHTSKMQADVKKSEKPSTNSKPPLSQEKTDKNSKNSKVKHSPQKDAKKEKIASEEKKDKREKESKDRDRSKEKSKSGSHSSPANKRPASPVVKKSTSPPPTVQKEKKLPSPKLKEKEQKKIVSDKDKEKLKESSKIMLDDKNERRKEKKKHKEDREKDKKEKHKDKEREKSKDKESSKNIDKKNDKEKEKNDKEKLEPKIQKEVKKSPKPEKEIEKIKDDKSKSGKTEKIEKPEKQKDIKETKEKSKHKHKKKDKKEKRDGSRDRDRKEKREKLKTSNEKQHVNSSLISEQTATNTIVPIELQDNKDSSDSAQSGDEEIIKKEISVKAEAEIQRTMSPPPVPTDTKKDKNDRKRERSKSGRNEDKEIRKKKRRSEIKSEEEMVVKKEKERDNSTSPLVEPVSSSQSPIERKNEHLQKLKDGLTNEQNIKKANEVEVEQVAPDSTNSTLVDTEEPHVFSDEYVSQLKDLQHKIMSQQDNEVLKRVVQVIAETGLYEVTTKTFDFDLCALDRRTVQRLQQFFSAL